MVGGKGFGGRAIVDACVVGLGGGARGGRGVFWFAESCDGEENVEANGRVGAKGYRFKKICVKEAPKMICIGGFGGCFFRHQVACLRRSCVPDAFPVLKENSESPLCLRTIDFMTRKVCPSGNVSYNFHDTSLLRRASTSFIPY